jgi:hypothetical protein
MKCSPIARVSLYKALDIKEKFHLLDAEGAVIETYIRKLPIPLFLLLINY